MAYSDEVKAWERRRKAAKRLRDQGWTLQRIATLFKVSPQRVHQWMRQ
jgi:uncharacterized protein YjcR